MSTSFFDHAHGFNVDTQIFTSGRVYQYRGSHIPDPLERLLGHVAVGAAHNSAERGADAPKCLPETRTAVQEEILSWIKHGGTDARILWLSGPAGAGKTAIAGTIADECQKMGWLAGSFFFSASSTSQERRTKDALVTTIAFHLCEHDGLVRLKDEILEAVDNNPAIFNKRLDEQLEVLILEPLRKALKAGYSESAWPRVIIIDGLDECDQTTNEMTTRRSSSLPFSGPQSAQPSSISGQEKVQLEILATLVRAVDSSGFPDSFPFRILVASRPERAIRDFFSSRKDFTHNIFLDNKYDPHADITLYLKAKFDAIRRRYEGLPQDWVSQEVIQFLAQEASGQFIYAATVVRFVEDTERPPLEQLQRVLEWRRLDGSKPFTPLDLLYTRIIQTSPNPVLAVKWMCSIRRFTTLLQGFFGQEAYKSALFTRYFLEAYPGEMGYLLGNLSSLLHLPSTNDIRFLFYHKSLFDFLENSERSSDIGLHVTGNAMEDFMKMRFLEIMKNRGPHVRPEGLSLSDFLSAYVFHSPLFLDHKSRAYTGSDVDWWTSFKVLRSDVDVEGIIRQQYIIAHRSCRWFSCRQACKVWRCGILRHCEAAGIWDIPGFAHFIRDRFRKYGSHDLPLRPRRPGGQSKTGLTPLHPQYQTLASFGNMPPEVV